MEPDFPCSTGKANWFMRNGTLTAVVAGVVLMNMLPTWVSLWTINSKIRPRMVQGNNLTIPDNRNHQDP